MRVIYETIFPKDPFAYNVRKVKFKFITEDWSLSFVVEGNFSERLLKQAILVLSPEERNKIVEIVKETFPEEHIGENEFSAITSVVAIKRILPS